MYGSLLAKVLSKPSGWHSSNVYQQQQQKQISQRLSLVARFSLVSFSVNKILEFVESIVSTAQSTATPYHSTLDVKRNENVMLLMKAPKKKLNDTYRQLQ